MPELPEVETVMRGMRPVMEGRRLMNVRLMRPNLRYIIPEHLPSGLHNQTVSKLIRRGKYIVALAGSSAGFILHLGMSGRIRLYSDEEIYVPEKHDHVIFEIEGGARVVFNDPRRFGFLDWVEADSWLDSPHFSKMGPEPLGNDFNGPVLAQALAGRKTSIKAALLDQRIVAGIGNIYACEALYDSRIHPERPAGSLKEKEAEDLVLAVKAVLLRAIAAGGSTLRDYRRADGELGYFQHQFSVYDRAGLACPDCHCDIVKTGGVQKIVQSGRSSYFCPQVQK